MARGVNISGLLSSFQQLGASEAEMKRQRQINAQNKAGQWRQLGTVAGAVIGGVAGGAGGAGVGAVPGAMIGSQIGGMAGGIAGNMATKGRAGGTSAQEVLGVAAGYQGLQNRQSSRDYSANNLRFSSNIVDNAAPTTDYSSMKETKEQITIDQKDLAVRKAGMQQQQQEMIGMGESGMAPPQDAIANYQRQQEGITNLENKIGKEQNRLDTEQQEYRLSGEAQMVAYNQMKNTIDALDPKSKTYKTDVVTAAAEYNDSVGKLNSNNQLLVAAKEKYAKGDENKEHRAFLANIDGDIMAEANTPQFTKMIAPSKEKNANTGVVWAQLSSPKRGEEGMEFAHLYNKNNKNESATRIKGVGGRMVRGGRKTTIGKDGTVTYEEGFPLGRRAMGDIESSLVRKQQLLGDVKRVRQLISPEFLSTYGQMKAKVLKFRQKAKIPEGVPLGKYINNLTELNDDQKQFVKEYNEFKFAVNGAFNLFRKDVTGAQASFQEIEFLKEQMINMDLSESEFQGRLDEWENQLNRHVEVLQQMRAEGYDVDNLKRRTGKDGTLEVDPDAPENQKFFVDYKKKDSRSRADQLEAKIRADNPKLSESEIEDMFFDKWAILTKKHGYTL